MLSSPYPVPPLRVYKVAMVVGWVAGMVAGAHVFRKYKVEIPGLVLALGGVVIYDYLSWLQTFTTAPGSGPRACLLILLAALLVARIRLLMHIDRQARRMASLRDRGTGE